MYESMQRELNDKLNIARIQGQNEVQKGQQIGNAISALGDAVVQGMSVYAQSTINREKYDLKQKLIAGQTDYLNVDNENASQDYSKWAESQLDQWAGSHGSLVKGFFNESKQSLLDEARTSFDTQLVNRIDARNKLNALETWDEALKAYNEDPTNIDSYEMRDVYKTTFSDGGMRVTHEKVAIDNLYDTESDNLSDKQKSFNKLLNVLYESQCLVTDQDTAKAYVNSQIENIENQVIQNDIISQADEWSKGLVDEKGNTIRHFTKDELIEEMKSQYSTGFERPYTNGKFTASESASIGAFIEQQVGNAYTKIYNDNKRALITDQDGWFAAQAITGPITSDIMYKHLAEEGMIEYENGKVVSHYGLDDSMWLEVKQIADGNDKIARADAWISDPRNLNEKGLVDLNDVPDDIRQLILQDSFGKAYVDSKYQYQSFDGSTRYAQSTVDAINRSRQTLQSLTPNITTSVAVYVDTGELPSGLELKSYDGAELPATTEGKDKLRTAQSIWYSYLIDAGYTEEVARDIVNANSRQIELDLAVSDVVSRLRDLKTADDYDSFIYTNAVEVGDKNPVTGSTLTADEAEYINDRVKKIYDIRLSKATPELTAEAAEKIAMLALDVEDTRKYYVSTLEDLSVFASYGYQIDSRYTYLGSETANAVLDRANANLEVILGTRKVEIDGEEKTFNVESFLADNLTEEFLADLKEACEKDDTLNYGFEYNLARNNALVSALSLIDGVGSDTIKAQYNEEASNKYIDDLKREWKSYKASVEGNQYYDKSVIQVDTFDELQEYAGKRITGTVSDSGNFKLSTSIEGWRGLIMDKIKQGQSVDYLKQWVQTSPYISESDTEKFLKMANSDFFQLMTNNPDLADAVTSESKKIHGVKDNELYWDCLFNTVQQYYTSLEKGQSVDLNEMISKTMSAYSQAYGEQVNKDIFDYEDGSTVYGTVDLGGGKDLSKTTNNRIDEYSVRYTNHEFDGAGVKYLIDSYMQKKGGIDKLRGELTAIAENPSNNHYVVMALSALGEDVSMLNPDADDFTDKLEKYFGRLNKNDESYDARYADHVLRVAGSFKAALGFFSDESVKAIGEVRKANYADNKFQTNAMTETAIKNGDYISKASDGTNILNVVNTDGSETQISLAFTTDEGMQDIRNSILTEMNEYVKTHGVYQRYNNYLMNPFNNNSTDKDTMLYMMEDVLYTAMLQCPSYQKYIAEAEAVTNSMSVPDKIFKVWYKAGSIQLDIVDGSVDKETSRVTDILKKQEEVKKNSDSVVFNPLNTNKASKDQQEINKGIIKTMTGI
jgi:hypothetical protein